MRNYKGSLAACLAAALFAIRKFLVVPSFGAHTPDGREVEHQKPET